MYFLFSQTKGSCRNVGYVSVRNHIIIELESYSPHYCAVLGSSPRGCPDMNSPLALSLRNSHATGFCYSCTEKLLFTITQSIKNIGCGSLNTTKTESSIKNSQIKNSNSPEKKIKKHVDFTLPAIPSCPENMPYDTFARTANFLHPNVNSKDTQIRKGVDKKGNSLVVIINENPHTRRKRFKKLNMCLQPYYDLLSDEQVIPASLFERATAQMIKLTNLKLHMHLELISKVSYFTDTPTATIEGSDEAEVQVGFLPSLNVNSESLDKVHEGLDKVSYLLQDKLPGSFERHAFAASFDKLASSFSDISRNSSPEVISSTVQGIALPYTSYLSKMGELAALTIVGAILARGIYTSSKVLIGFSSICFFVLSFIFPDGALVSFYQGIKSKVFNVDFFSSDSESDNEEIQMEETCKCTSEKDWPNCDYGPYVKWGHGRHYTVEPQFGVDDFSTTFGLGLSSVLLYYSKGECKSLPKEIYDKLNSFGKIKSSVVDISNLMISLFSDTINYILENILGMKKVNFFQSSIVAIDNYYERAGQILDDHASETVIKTAANSYIVHDLLNEGEMILKKVPIQKEFNTVRQMLRERVQKVAKLNGEYLSSKFSCKGARVETVCVMMRGGPGSYKSIAMERLSYAMCAMKIDDEAEYQDFLANPSVFMYNRQPETVYWDGYTSKVITVFIDDFGQAKEVAGNPDNETFSLIRIINGFQTNLHMAQIELKQNTVFTSPFLLCTTNQKVFQPCSIIDTSALLRRFTVDVVCTVKEKYALPMTDKQDLWNRKTDVSKLPIDPETGLTMITEEINEFYFCTEDGVPMGEPMEFEQLARITFEQHRKRVGWHSKHRSEFLNTASIFRSIREEETGEGIPTIIKITQDDLSRMRCSNVNPRKRESYLESKTPSTIIENDVDKYRKSKTDYEVEPQYGDPSIPNGAGLPSNFKGTMAKSFKDYMVCHAIRGIIDYKEFVVKYPCVFGFILGLVFTFASAGLTHLLAKLYSLFTGTDDKSMPEPQSFGFSDKMRKPAQAKSNKPSSKDFIQSLKMQNAQHGDSSGNQIVDSFTHRNVWRIYTKTGDQENQFGFAINVCGDRVVIPYHFMKYFISESQKDIEYLNTVVHFAKNGQAYAFDTTVKYMLLNHYSNILENYDACILVLPSHFPKSQNNLSKFALYTDHEHSQLNLDFVLAVPHKHAAKHYAGKAIKATREITMTSNKFDSYTLTDTYMYDAATSKGDCGAPFYIMNPRVPGRKIFGFHVAGNAADGRGFSTVLSQELLTAQMEEIELPTIILKEDYPTDNAIVETQNGMHCLGNISPVPNRVLSTEYKRSLLNDKVFPSTKVLAQLSPVIVDGVKIDLLERAAKKYCPEMKPLILEDFQNLSYELYSWMISKGRKQFNNRVLTLEEALDGVVDTCYYSTLNPKSKGGYPMNCSGVRDLKAEYVKTLTGSPERLKLVEEIRVLVNEVIEDAKKGIRHNWIYTDCSKDEKISIEKLKDLKTRMFSGGNFIYVLVWRMYNGSFDMFFNANNLDIGASAGINPNSTDWDRLTRALNKFGTTNNVEDCMVGAGDHSGFDTRHHPGVLKIAGDITNMWYADSDENQKVRDVLNIEMYNSLHLNLSGLYYWNGSLPSGHPATFRINSLINIMAFMHCWYEVTPANFFENVCVVTGGDDVIFSVSDNYKDKFNEMTLTGLMSNIGYVYTTETKGKAEFTFRKLKEVEFLKRGFRVNSYGKVFAPLRYEVCLETCQWTTKKNAETVIVSNVIASLDEISVWYSSTYKEERERAMKDYALLLKGFKEFYPFLTVPENFHIPIEVRNKKALNQIHFF